MPFVWSTKIAIEIYRDFHKPQQNNTMVRPYRCKAPYQAPPLSVGARTRNSKCPTCDGRELTPAAGGDEVVSTHTIPEEEAQIILPGLLELFFCLFSVI